MSDEIDIERLSGEGAREQLREESQRILKKYGFQSVAIFATLQTSEGRTFHVPGLAGNMYAINGQVRLWIVSEDEIERMQTRQGEK